MNFEAGAGAGVLAPDAAALARFNALRALVFLLSSPTWSGSRGHERRSQHCAPTPGTCRCSCTSSGPCCWSAPWCSPPPTCSRPGAATRPTRCATALRTLTLGAFPGYIILRGSSEWIADKEGWNDVTEPPNWIDIGYIIADAGLLLLVVASLAGWLALRRGVAGGVRVAAVLVALLIVADVVAIWAMTTKPV